MDHKVPVISGLSPLEGLPGTTVTFRGENLGNDPTDILALVICGTDCLLSLKWKSSSKIVARIGNAKRGLGDIILLTKSGGKAVSNVQFRVLIEQVGPLTESAVWVDETRTVPCRSQVRNVAEVVEISDALGLNKKSATEKPKVGYNDLVKLFPDSSGNLRMGNFNPAWYLLENHKDASFSDLLKGTDNLKKEIAKEKQLSNDVHRDNLYSLINCVDSLNSLNTLIEKDAKEHNWPLTGAASKLVDTANQTADNLFSDVLSRKDRADSTRNALSVLNRFKYIFFLTKSIDENLQQGDYAAILNDYTRVKALYKDSEITLFKEVMNVLEMKMANFKEILKHNLISSPSSFEEQSRLIKYLKILDPDSNPAWECITSYHCWLESILWENQNRYCKLANEEVNDQLEFANFESGSNYIQTFVTEILSLLTEKLPAFWKLAQNYSDASDEKYLAQQDDINQMLANTINVTSWILLNALVPSALPEAVTQQYKSEFAVWPTMNQRDKSIQLNQLLLALKSLRSTVKSLLESQFSRSSVFPLTELCKTLRLKSVELLTAKSIEGILNLVNQETWSIEIDVRAPKTTIPDLFETQLNDVLPHINQILSTNGYPSEEDLFSKDSIRQIVVDRIIMMVTSIRDCYEQLLQLKFKRRPNRLFLLDTSDIASNTSSNEDNLERSRSSEVVTRRLLICVCNFDYILCHSLPLICKRLSNTKSKQEFLNFRQELINKYLTIKTSPLVSLIESSSYSHLPGSDDVSTFVKELIMGIIFIKAELYLLLPQLSDVILKSAIENLIQRFLQFIADVNISNNDIATQVAIDISGTEEALHSFLPKQQRDKINSIRAQLIKRLDKTVFESSTRSFRASMQLAIESLDSGDKIKQDDELDSSDMGFLKKWFISFFLIEFGLHIGKFLTTEAKYALFSRLVEVTFLTFAMLLGSWFFLTKRLTCTSLNINPKARCFLKACFVMLAIFTHIAYMFFYVDFNENSWIVYLCFISFALYLHLVIIGFLFFLYEQIAKRVLPDRFSVFVSTTFHTLIALILAIALTAHGLSVARDKPITNVIDINIRELPARFNGFSIALLTDLHIGPTVSRQRVEDIVEIVNNLKVDAVAIVGDLLDGYIEHIRHKALPLKNLKPKSGTFYVLGNHELYHGDIHALDKFVRNDLNLTFLHNDHYLIQRDQDSICFAGVDDIKSDSLKYKDYKMDPEKALSGCPKGSTVILLVHQPNAGYKILQTSKITKQKVDLMLAGHTHNGQFYLMFPIGYFTNKYLHGLYRTLETQIFVSAGVNYWGPPVKFLCEIPIIKRNMRFKELGIYPRVAIYLISLFLGAYLIRAIGNKTTTNLSGYELGNRRRSFAVVRLLWIMIHLSVPIYLHLFSVFKEDKYQSLSTKNSRLKQRALFTFWFVIINAHLCYLFYIINFPVPWLLFEISAICTGAWLHLVFFSFLFLGANLVIDCIKLIEIGRKLLDLLFLCRPLKRIATDSKLQVGITVWATIILSALQYSSSDHIFVKEAEFSLSKWPSNQPPMRFAILTDLHTGGSVYTEQINKVVSLTNSLNADAIFLIGDTVDAPRSWIEERTHPLKNLVSKHGSYLVTGNHEYYYGSWLEWKQLFTEFGINVLENNAVNIGPLCVVGLNDVSSNRSGILNHSMDATILKNCSKNNPIAVLAHNPAASPKILNASNIVDRHVDLIMSGHTHGGQYYVLVPFVYYLLPYLYGIYPLNAGTTQLLVSAGTLYQAAPMKMPFYSEIWVVTLKAA